MARFNKKDLMDMLEENSDNYSRHARNEPILEKNNIDNKFIEFYGLSFSIMMIITALKFIFGIPGFLAPLLAQIPSHYFSLFFYGVSFVIGRLIQKSQRKLFGYQKELEKITHAKTETERVEFEIKNKIEMAKSNYRIKAIKKALDDGIVVKNIPQVSGNPNALVQLSKKDQAKLTLDNINKRLNEKFEELDLYATRMALHEECMLSRDFFEKFDEGIHNTIYGLFIFMAGLLPSKFFEDVTALGTPLSCTVALFFTLLALVSDKIFTTKKIRDNKKAFNKINRTLGDKALKKSVWKTLTEKRKLTEELDQAINETSKMLVLAESQKYYLQKLEEEEEKEKVLEPTVVHNLGMLDSYSNNNEIDDNLGYSKVLSR